MATPDPYLRGHGDTRYRVVHYDLQLAYKVSTNRLDEQADLEIEVAQPTSKIELDLYRLQADKVQVNGHRAKFHVKGNKVIVEVGVRRPGERLRLSLKVSGKPGPMPGVHGEAGWEELSDGAMVGSQPQGAPTWFPCNNDAADKATYRISVTTEAAYQVIANGSLIEQVRVGGNIRWTYLMDRPMAPYLATVQIGQYAVQPRVSVVPVEIVHPLRVGVGPGTAFARQGQMMDLFCDLFGDYPFDEYRAVIVSDPLEIPLEAQGLSSFGRNFVTPTWNHERLVAHELAHQWFGNSVTGALLRDIWLHEGFACYSEWLWSDHRRTWCAGLTVQELAAKHYAELPRKISHGTLADPGMKQMFDDWVYKRGALTLHAIRVLVGDRAFFTLLRRWAQENAGTVVTTEDFVEHCCRCVPEQDAALRQTLDAWLHRPELPPLPQLG